MEHIINIGKRGITAILTLCLLLGIAGFGVQTTAMAAETTATTEENAIVTAEETTQELVPMMARACGPTLDDIFGKGYQIERTSGPWQYISGACGITGGYNTTTGYGYVEFDDGTIQDFYVPV